MSTVHSTGARPSRMMLAWRWLSVLMLVLPLVLTPAAQAAPIALSVHAQETPPTSSTLALEANLPGNSDPVLTEEERLWQQIEAATNAGDRAALPALIQELARFDLPAAIRLAREIAPPVDRPAPAPVGPISREEELQQAAADAANRAELLRQEAVSREQALRPTPADDEKWATPPGDAAPQRPAATLTVGDSCTYATIQGAVNAAASGDTILVQGKTFTGADATININAKSLTLSGGWNSTCTAQGSTRTVMDATGRGDSGRRGLWRRRPADDDHRRFHAAGRRGRRGLRRRPGDRQPEHRHPASHLRHIKRFLQRRRHSHVSRRPC
ncbi:MAG: hypothetical protein IPO15_00715 [Anaerolineae bacterium]|uniref:hypothetical protein n=1 Tax=Candidatus Amarolinea dominans TaxID=3140696 RepID=UPI003134AE5A|nr:hypothetical protein [Anaerolineae bacterium]